MNTETADTAPGAAAHRPTVPGLGLLLRVRLTVLRNRVRQLIDQSPLRLLLVMVFIGVIWGSLYLLFDYVFRFMRRDQFEQQAVIAIPYVFHIFFAAMTLLLAFSTAVIAYASLFSGREPSFLIAAPNQPRSIVAIMYLEALFFASWSLLLLGIPLMLAIANVQGLAWHFYTTFIVAFLGFVPIPGALGLCAAWAVAMWMPRSAKRALFWGAALMLALVILWWGRLWALSSGSSLDWLKGFMTEMSYLKGTLLPSTWVTYAIRLSIEDKPASGMFYLAVTVANALFLSWAAVNIVGSNYLSAFGRAHAAPSNTTVYSGWASRWLSAAAFFYLPTKLRALILKDVRTFLRDPVQWAQLLILFGLLSLYLTYLPRTRPDGFNLQWKAFICFLNYGAITLILSTFTSRFVFPLISIEGQQMWLVGLWPIPRGQIMWAKFAFAMTITLLAGLGVTWLSIRALDLPWSLAMMQAVGTASACFGLCGLAVGLGARLPNYQQRSANRIASGLGGTVNLIASIALVTAVVVLMGLVCYRMAIVLESPQLDSVGYGLFAAMALFGLGAGLVAMRIGAATFRKAEF